MNLYKRDYIILTLFLTVILSYILNVYFNSYDYGDAEKLIATQEKIHTIKIENDTLRVQLLQATSYTQLQEKAKELGFTQEQDYIYLH